jgi:hypothetical protein
MRNAELVADRQDSYSSAWSSPNSRRFLAPARTEGLISASFASLR